MDSKCSCSCTQLILVHTTSDRIPGLKMLMQLWTADTGTSSLYSIGPHF